MYSPGQGVVPVNIKGSTEMNREVKFVLFFIAIVLSGSTINFIKQHVAQNQFERLNTALTENSEPSSEQFQQGILEEQKEQQQSQLLQVLEQERDQQAQIAEDRLIEAINEQRKLGKYLSCATSINTGECSCQDKRDGTVVGVSSERCNHYVDRQVASIQVVR
jgi:hypothetical protein